MHDVRTMQHYSYQKHTHLTTVQDTALFQKKTSTRVRPDERAPYDISDRSPAGCARSQRSKREQVTLPTQLRLCNARARTHLQKRA